MTTRRWWLAVLGAVLVVAVTAIYRFGLLGGQLGGFENDEYLVISRAQALLLRGELPSRDYVDPGYPLAYLASALAMWATSGTLLGHAVLSVAMLAAGAGLTYAIAARASGSLLVGVLMALVQFGLGPRMYNYPKIVLYALAVLGWWAYADRPARPTLLMLAGLTAVAFLFRHDHGVYIAAGTGVLLLTLLRDHGWSQTIGSATIYGLVTAACLVPYLAYVQVNGGLMAHVRTGSEFSRVDRARTQLRWPVFTWDHEAPLLTVTPAPVAPPPRIKVRWQPPAPGADAVTAFAERHNLRLAGTSDDAGAEFVVLDDTPAVLRRIAADPAVADTQNIDRDAWRIVERPALSSWERIVRDVPVLRVELLPGILAARNAAPFVYYLWLVLPVAVSAAALLDLWQGREDAWPTVHRLAPVVAVMLALNVWFLRGTLPVRLADVSVLAAALGAWGLARAWQASRAHGLATRVAVGAVLGALALGATASAFAVGQVGSNVRMLTDGGRVSAVPARIEAVARQLATPGPVLAADGAPTSPVMRLADYLHTCLAPTQRALVVAYMPEVFFFAERPFAGGQIDIRAGYLATDADQRLTIARLDAQASPIVVTEDTATFESRYPRESPQLVDYIRRAYRDTGDHDFGGVVFRVFVRPGVNVPGTYAGPSAPCLRVPA